MKKTVLFLCTGNSCRSQMAEGWLRHLAGERFEALSAGTNPQGLNPLAVRVMGEAGVDISAQRSKHVDEVRSRDLDLLVTVCGGRFGPIPGPRDTGPSLGGGARESCPLFLGAVGDRRHWPVPDPAEARGTETEVLAAFRLVREELRARVEDLAAEEA